MKTKHLTLVVSIILLSSCGLQNYSSPSVEASNGLVPNGYQQPGAVVVGNNKTGVFAAPQGGPAAVAAERASKAQDWNTLPH